MQLKLGMSCSQFAYLLEISHKLFWKSENDYP